jgi:hypothetical protein
MRCPVCKADNAEGPQCRRCKADLRALFALEDCRCRALSTARRCLSTGHWADALRHAAIADQLESDADSRRVLAVASLLNHDYATALDLYRRSNS